jgi:flagellar motor switch protein FliM
MAKILTQEEIDLLLGSAGELKREEPPVPVSMPTISSVTYDFRRPDRVSKEQLRSLHLLHDRFARNVSASLSAYLRTVTDVSIVSVEQLTYAEFLMSLPDPTAFYALMLTPTDGVAALELNPMLAFTMIDRILGGSGKGILLSRALTEIEQQVVDGIIKLILENLADAWKPTNEVQFRITGRETRPQMLQVAAPNETVLLLVFDVRLGEARGMLNFCLPAATIEGFGDVFTQGWYRSRRDPTAAQRENLLRSLGRVHIPITALLEVSMSGREVVQLRPGDVVSLGRPVTQPVKVKVGNTMKYAGRLVRHGSRVAVAISEGPGMASGRPREGQGA